MKARISWVVEGDRNSSFFHTFALVRRRRNKIHALKDRMGNWLQGDREVAEHIRKEFMDLFSSSQVSAPFREWHLLFGIVNFRGTMQEFLKPLFQTERSLKLSNLLNLIKPQALMDSMQGFFSAFLAHCGELGQRRGEAFFQYCQDTKVPKRDSYYSYSKMQVP